MLSNFINQINQYKCVAITGLAKNTGKTTVLNQILSEASNKVLGLTSIGYDGESSDLVTQTEKPRIYVKSGSLIATADGLLPYCDFTRELLTYTGFNSPMGEIIIVRALSDGYAQIAGPSTRLQMESTVDLLRNLGAEQIFIDGALSRKSIAAVCFSDACILATGAAFSHNIENIIDESVFFAELLTLPKFKESHKIDFTVNGIDDNEVCSVLTKLKAEDTLFISGAITSQLLKRIFNCRQNINGLNIIGEDGTRFLINNQLLSDLKRRNISLYVKNPINLIAITVNPKSPYGLVLDSNEICSRLRSKLKITVLDIMKEI